MNQFFLDLIRLYRIVTVGRSESAVAVIRRISLERLMLGEALMGFLIGLNLLITQDSARAIPTLMFLSPWHLFSFPVFLLAVTLIWCYAFLFLAGITADRNRYHALFFGSSLFLAPAVIPLLGAAIFPILLLGWPFVLGRFLAAESGVKPGRVLMYLVAPPVFVWVVLRLVFIVIGRVLSL